MDDVVIKYVTIDKLRIGDEILAYGIVTGLNWNWNPTKRDPGYRINVTTTVYGSGWLSFPDDYRIPLVGRERLQQAVATVA